MINGTNERKASKKRIIVFAVFAVIAVVWMVMIFMFSASEAKVSSSQSGGVTQAIVRVVDKDYVHPEKMEENSFSWKADHLVRKSAHIFCYFLLSALVFAASGAIIGSPSKVLKPSVISAVVSLLYSSADEYHQTFVDGRSGSVKDVAIDSIGIALGILLCIAVCKIYVHFSIKKAKK